MTGGGWWQERRDSNEDRGRKQQWFFDEFKGGLSNSGERGSNLNQGIRHSTGEMNIH